MNTPTHLIDAYLDDSLTPEESSELQRWLAADRQHVREFVLAVHEHRTLHEHARTLRADAIEQTMLNDGEGLPVSAPGVKGAEAHAASPVSVRPTSWRHQAGQIGLPVWRGFWHLVSRARITWAVVGATVMLAIGLLFFNGPNQGVLPEVVFDDDAQSTFVRPPDTLTRRLARSLARYRFPPLQSMARWLEGNGSRYGPGSVVEVGAGSRAHLRYTNETTVIRLKENTKLKVLSARAGKRFELMSGMAEIHAAPQPAAQPLQVVTPMAKVRVTGTKLSLRASGRSTRVSVTEGKVQLESRTTRQHASVTAGQRAIAATNSRVTTDTLRPITNHFGTGSILREHWLDVRGMKVQDLLTNANFLNRPNGSERVASLETESAGPGIDFYGARFRGYLHPPVSGEYTFWVAADDAGELWLSTDEKPENKRLVCAATTWSLFFRNWWKSSEQESAPIYLVGGKRYFIEALHKESGGGDFFSAAWETPGSEPEVIDGADLSPFESVQ